MNLDTEQAAAIELMQAGHNTFLTGNAGTGKSTVVTEFVGQSFRRLDITATTGIAAINLQDTFRARAGVTLKASTIYRWAGINIGPRPGQTFSEFFLSLERAKSRNFWNACARIKSAEALLIDEISMLPGRTLDYLDFHCRQVRGNDRPFGGIQVIAVGDFLQLPPVAKDGKYDWAFQSKAWGAARFKTAHLNTIHRQDDPDFVQVLNDFRNGRIRGRSAEILAGRVTRFPSREITRLLTHNAQVNRWNSYQLECIESPSMTFAAEKRGKEADTAFLLKNMITPEQLELKEGARIMVTRNLTADGDLIVANGATGKVTALPAAPGGAISVEIDGGEPLQVETYEFRFDPTDPESAAVIQYPLRLAYAMTIHKSQGLTLDRAVIDIRAAREPGQAYVALSRLRRLQGLHLKDWIKGVFVSPAAINFYRNLKSA